MWCDQVADFLKRHSTVPAAVVVFACAYLIMLAVNAGDAGAAWVQAVGSIAAIGVAIWVAELGHRRDRVIAAAAEALEEFRVAELAAQSAYECYLSVTRLREQLVALETLAISKVNMGRLNQATEVLRAVLQQKLPAAFIGEVFKVLAHAGEVDVEVSEWTPFKTRDGAEQFLDAHIAAIKRSYEFLYREYIVCADNAGEWVNREPRP